MNPKAKTQRALIKYRLKECEMPWKGKQDVDICTSLVLLSQECISVLTPSDVFNMLYENK